MKQMIVGAGLVALCAGCAFNPESMPIGQKDTAVYVDAGAPKELGQKEAKAKVAVITSEGDYKDYKQVTESLDSSLNAKLSGFSFFEVVDRKSQAALIKDAVIAGGDLTEIAVKGVESDFVVVVRIASLLVRESVGRKNSKISSSDVTFDFKWIDTDSKRVVMTESIKPPVGAASSSGDVFASLSRAAETAVSEFCTKIAVKYAPKARVLQTRGNGAAARISIGKNYGLSEGTEVCFYEIIDNSDVGGKKRDVNDIATGKVRRVEADAAWVKVNKPEETNVRKGVYVRVIRQGSVSILDDTGLALPIGN